MLVFLLIIVLAVVFGYLYRDEIMKAFAPQEPEPTPLELPEAQP